MDLTRCGWRDWSNDFQLYIYINGVGSNPVEGEQKFDSSKI